MQEIIDVAEGRRRAVRAAGDRRGQDCDPLLQPPERDDPDKVSDNRRTQTTAGRRVVGSDGV